MTVPTMVKKSQSEAEFEKELIHMLTTGADSNLNPLVKAENGELANTSLPVWTRNWVYKPEIKTEEDLWQNFKEILEQHNQNSLDHPLSPTEFNQVKKVITDLNTPFQAGQFLYGLNGVTQIEVDLDDGRHVFLDVFDQAEVGAGNTVYQVVNQISCTSKAAGRQNKRFDVTLLINGLPLIQIELKKDTGDVNDALNQMHQYLIERQYTGIFSTLQLLIAMTPNDAVYMANTTPDRFNKDFAFHWQNPSDNKPVRNWKQFTNHVLSIPAAHNLATNYMILDGTENNESIKVMRPYQVMATEKAIDAIRKRDVDANINKLGYIWHTTGSGKTITSFKTAWLASNLPQVDKVVFLVDRKQLTRQTLDKYRAYDPDAGSNFASSITNTNNTWELASKLKSKSREHKIIVTSVQKLEKLARSRTFKAPDQKIVFIVDEAHRSTGGEAFKAIQEKFKHGSWLGYTGTPIFEEKKDRVRTVDLFGNCLHAYTIREAIQDRNVLGFHVDFQTTIPNSEIEQKYLPEFYKRQNPDWTDEKIRERIENMTDEDFDDETAAFYDENPAHVRAVVKDIFNNWNARSQNGKYNAMLTTHVGGGKPSSKMALMYYHEFKRVNAEREKEGKPTLKVGITYSLDTSNKNKMIEANNGLLEAIQDYNKMYGTHFDLSTVEEYKDDLQARLSGSTTDGGKLDLVIVVDQLLTGFDAPNLNTLYVDRSLRGANLVQAYSRTNRISDMLTKPFGNIVNYRWPKKNEELMNKALAMYANKDYIDQVPDDGTVEGEEDIPEGVLAPNFEEELNTAKDLVKQIEKETDGFSRVPESDGRVLHLADLYRKYVRSVNKLKQYSIEQITECIGPQDPEECPTPLDLIIKGMGMTNEQAQTLSNSIRNELVQRVDIIKKRDNPPILPEIEMDLPMLFIKEVRVNYDYLTELLENLMNQTHEKSETKADETMKQIQEFANSLEDRTFAKQILMAAKMIRNGEFPLPDSELKYPYKLHESRELIQTAETVSFLKLITRFVDRWGIQKLVDVEEFKKYLSAHTYGDREDLNIANRLTELQKAAQFDYQENSTDSEVKKMSRLRYRNGLFHAVYELADTLVATE